MRYTDYLLHEQFVHIEDLETDTFYLKPLSVFLGIPITIGTFMIIGGLLPMTLIVDGWNKKRPHRKALVKLLYTKLYDLSTLN